jgi:deazaflavin-dependent oxidoreductase (nitroreductase family)
MRKTITAVILGLGIAAVIFVVGMRRKTPVVLNAVRRSGRAMKPLVLRSAGTADSPTAVVEHVGRTSGRRYDTPVVAAPTDDGFVIALPYGPNTDWLKNVLTAGRATIRFQGASHDVEHPELVDIDQVDEHFAPKEQRAHRRFQVHDALMVRTVSNVTS